MKKTFILTLLALIPVMTSNMAAAVSCSDTKSGLFDNDTELNAIYSACLDAGMKNGNKKAMNSGALFGITTWTMLEKATKGRSDGLINLDVQSVGDVSGSISFDASIWNEYDEIAVALKGGKTAGGINRSIYLLNQDIDEAFWVYGHGKKGKLKHLAQLTVYGSEASVVPVPAAFWLFFSGLIALFAVVRKKR